MIRRRLHLARARHAAASHDRALRKASRRRINAYVRPIESAPIRRSHPYSASENAALAALLARLASPDTT